MTEKRFQAQIVKLAKLHGWLVYHTFDSRRSTAGFPDLVLVKGDQIIFAELKTKKGKVKPEQKAWLIALNNAGKVRSCVWRPQYDASILAVLATKPSEAPQNPTAGLG